MHRLYKKRRFFSRKELNELLFENDLLSFQYLRTPINDVDIIDYRKQINNDNDMNSIGLLFINNEDWNKNLLELSNKYRLIIGTTKKNIYEELIETTTCDILLLPIECEIMQFLKNVQQFDFLNLYKYIHLIHENVVNELTEHVQNLKELDTPFFIFPEILISTNKKNLDDRYYIKIDDELFIKYTNDIVIKKKKYKFFYQLPDLVNTIDMIDCFFTNINSFQKIIFYDYSFNHDSSLFYSLLNNGKSFIPQESTLFYYISSNNK